MELEADVEKRPRINMSYVWRGSPWRPGNAYFLLCPGVGVFVLFSKPIRCPGAPSGRGGAGVSPALHSH